MGTPVRAALGGLRAIGPRASVFTDFLSDNSKGFIAENEKVSESFPLVERRTGAKGYGLFCGPRPARAGEEVLRVPPAVWLPYCAEAAVRKAEAGAPEVLARLSNACAKVAGGDGDASKLASVACLALELLFTLERDAGEPYLGLLWEASESEGSLPHPLLMGPEHLDLLQASPLRDSIVASSRIYSTIHRSIFGLGEEAGSLSSGEDNPGRTGTSNMQPSTPPGGTMAAPSALRTRDFLWALGVILSRGVSEDGAGGTGLVPYLDFANHGETCSSGLGGGETASCERGFDAATGSHVLRALRDVAPGEELLIDYGSKAKGMYRFARTYGFIHFGYDDIERSRGPDGSGIDGDDQANNRRQGERGGSGSWAGSPKDSLRVRVDAATPSPHLVVPVRLADAAAAPLAAGDGAATTVAVGGAGTGAGDGTTAAAPNGARAVAEVKALEERLHRYPTTVEEDLELLRRRPRRRTELHHVEIAKSAAPAPAEARGAITEEWVRTCVALRAAEKIALGRELRERKPLPRND